MKLTVTFDSSEVRKVQDIVAHKLASRRRFVQDRLYRNVEGPVPEADDDTLWMTHMMCLLTTQQRSGPDSAVYRLLNQTPFPLSLAACRQYTSLEETAHQLLKGFRRNEKIPKAISANLYRLEHGEWDELRRWRDKLYKQRSTNPTLTHRFLEEEAARHMTARFTEFGPKQSRNFWQSLGLTRYVFVLDSRILKWVRSNLSLENGLLTSQGLGDNEYYQFISDILLELCTQADVLPCMFDVAIYDSFDETSEWGNVRIW